MIAITQVITRKSDNEKFMYLGFDDIWRIHLLDKNLDEVIMRERSLDRLKDFEATPSDPVFIDCGTYYGCIDIQKLYDHYGKENVKKFIRQEV